MFKAGLFFTIGVLLLTTIWIPSSYAYIGLSEDFGMFNILTGEILSLDAAEPKRVQVRDPQVLEIVKITKSAVEVIGKGEGKTEVVIYDGEGIRSYTVSVYGEDLIYLREKIKDLLYSRLGIRQPLEFYEDELSHKLIIKGQLFESDLKMVADALKPVEKFIVNYISAKKRDEMIKIDVQVLEVDKQAVDTLGFDWIDSFKVREEEYQTPGDDDNTTLKTPTGDFGTVFRFRNMSRDALVLKLNALISRGKGKVLSRPQLVCASGEEANVIIGGEVPIDSSTSTDSGTTTSTSYKEYGVRLKIKPEILPDNRIKLNVNSEISEIDDDNSFTTTAGKKYAFLKRNAVTQLLVNSGETILIAGMIQNRESNNDYKVPFFGDIPWLGVLFRYRDKSVSQREVIISISSEIVPVPVLEQDNGPVPQARPNRAVAPEQETMNGYASTKAELYTIPDNSSLGFQRTSGKNQAMSQAVTNYIYTIQGLITQALKNPPLSTDPAWESSMKLRMHLLSDGTLSAAQVIEHSGYRIFDDYVLNMAQKIGPYPYFPAGMNQEDIWIDIPIIYTAAAE
mgnify:CR=1 FL=1